MRENEILTSDAVMREYALSEPLAREIVAEETRKALLRSWIAWLIFLGGLAAAGWAYVGPDVDRNAAVWILLGATCVWMLAGRYLAGPAIRRAAAEKAARLKQPIR